MRMKIGFIGLGIMGSCMAANRQKHDYSLVVFNRPRGKAQSLLDRGATFADSPANWPSRWTCCSRCWLIPTQVEQATLGANGFLSYLKSNALRVDCNSVNPSFSKKMAAAAAADQIRIIDAPVTGSAPVAADGKLIFWVGFNVTAQAKSYGRTSVTMSSWISTLTVVPSAQSAIIRALLRVCRRTPRALRPGNSESKVRNAI
jgi:3-hydroxyisobutyrate dehydrogenase-like beta-hydroxyacid dehydrogenase